jgi:hypothetical protein
MKFFFSAFFYSIDVCADVDELPVGERGSGRERERGENNSVEAQFPTDDVAR